MAIVDEVAALVAAYVDRMTDSLVGTMTGHRSKSINEVARNYDTQLSRFALQVLHGMMDAVDFRRAHKVLLHEMARAMGTDGWLEGGGKADDFEGDDLAVMDEWERDQASYVNDFAAWLASPGEDGKRNSPEKRAALDGRIEAWVSSLINLGDQMKARAKGDPFLTFQGDDGLDSCEECQEYQGQRHKLSWWEKRGLTKRNGNDAFGCGRWDTCNHHFYYDNGEMAIE